MATNYFYYITHEGNCSNGHFQLETTGKPNFADVCAWKPSLPDAIYGCDAWGGCCWTSPQPCGAGFQNCTGSSGEQWCCRDEIERCGKTHAEPYTCWPSDLCNDNPMRSHSQSIATESAESLLRASGLTISTPVVAEVTSVGRVISPPTSLTVSATSLSSLASSLSAKATFSVTPSSSPSTSLSTGQVAGLVVASLAILVAAFLGTVIIWQRRWRSHTNTYSNSSEMLACPSVGELADNRTIRELPDNRIVRELPAPAALTSLDHTQRHELSTQRFSKGAGEC